jgi:hypothetical protein
MEKLKGKPSIESPFLETGTGSRMQFGLGTLLIAMAVFAVASACFLFASQLPIVSKEIHAWMGTVPPKSDNGADRFFQLIFLIICYSSPLILAAILNLMVQGVRYLESKQSPQQNDQDKEWEME